MKVFDLREYECPYFYINYFFFLGEFDFSILIEFLCSLLYYWVNIHDQISLNSDVCPGNGLVPNVPQRIPWVKGFID